VSIVYHIHKFTTQSAGKHKPFSRIFSTCIYLKIIVHVWNKLKHMKGSPAGGPGKKYLVK